MTSVLAGKRYVYAPDFYLYLGMINTFSTFDEHSLRCSYSNVLFLICKDFDLNLGL